MQFTFGKSIPSLIKEVVEEIKNVVSVDDKIGNFKLNNTLFENSENFEPITDAKVKLDEGVILINVEPKPELFYKVLSRSTGTEIQDDYHLISSLI